MLWKGEDQQSRAKESVEKRGRSVSKEVGKGERKPEVCYLIKYYSRIKKAKVQMSAKRPAMMYGIEIARLRKRKEAELR